MSKTGLQGLARGLQMRPIQSTIRLIGLAIERKRLHQSINLGRNVSQLPQSGDNLRGVDTTAPKALQQGRHKLRLSAGMQKYHRADHEPQTP